MCGVRRLVAALVPNYEDIREESGDKSPHSKLFRAACAFTRHRLVDPKGDSGILHLVPSLLTPADQLGGIGIRLLGRGVVVVCDARSEEHTSELQSLRH